MLKRLLLATTGLLLVSVIPAQAGPVVTGLGALMSTTIAGTGATVGGILGGAAFSFGASYLFNLMFGPETKQRGVKQEVSFGAGLPPSFIVGTYATPGVLLYEGVYDGGDNIPNQCLVQVIGLSMLPVKGLQSEVFIQGEPCHINMSSAWGGGFKEISEYVKGGGGGGYCLMKFHDGRQNAVDGWLLDKFGDHPIYPIHPDCWWRGCAYVIIQSWYSNKGIWTGLPEFKFVVEGIDLYDPRKDGTLPGGSGGQRWGQPGTWGAGPSNAKVFEFNLLRGIQYKGKRVWGGDAEAYRLPLDYWFAAMNACDEDIELGNGGTVKRGHIGAEIFFDDDPREIIAEINKSVCGYTTLQGGQYKTWCGAPGLPVMTITDEDWVVTQEREDDPYGIPEETYNTAYGSYVDPRDKWSMKDSPRFVDDDALDEDGRERALDVSLPFVTHWQHCQRVLRQMVKDAQRVVTHRGQLPPEAYALEPFDRVLFKSNTYRYYGDGRPFRVDVKEDLPSVRQDVLLREINVSDSGWAKEYELEDSVGGIGNLVLNPRTLGLTLTPAEVTRNGGKDRPALLITWSWAAQDTGVKRILWRLKKDGVKVGEGQIRRVEDGDYMLVHPSLRFGDTYNIQFLFVHETPRLDEWSGGGSITMLPPDPLQPTSLTATGQVGRIVCRTTKSANKNFSHWNLYVSETNQYNDADDPIAFKGKQMSIDDLPPGATRFVWITEVDRWGNESVKFPAGNTNGRTATTRRVVSGDLSPGSVDNAAIDNNAVDTPKIKTKSIEARFELSDIDGTSQNWDVVSKNKKAKHDLAGGRSKAKKIFNPNPSAVTLRISYVMKSRTTIEVPTGTPELHIYRGSRATLTVGLKIYSAPAGGGKAIVVHEASVKSSLEGGKKRPIERLGSKKVSKLIAMDLYKGSGGGDATPRIYWAETSYSLAILGEATVTARGSVKKFKVEGSYSKR